MSVFLQLLLDSFGIFLGYKLDRDLPLRFKNRRSYVLYHVIALAAAVAFIAGLMFLAWLVWYR